MNNKKPSFFKRSIAFLTDFVIVMLISGVITTIFINNDDYKVHTEKLLEITSKHNAGEISDEEYLEEYNDVYYYMTKESIDVTLVNSSVAIIYYVILCFYCNGITLGKYLLKLRIVGAKDQKLNLGNYLIRALLVDLILSNLASIICVMILSKESFIAIYPKVSSVFVLFLLSSMLLIVYRDDGRGLHDILAKTKVVSFSKNKKEDYSENNEESSEIKDANVVEEKKITNKKKTRNKKESSE